MVLPLILLLPAFSGCLEAAEPAAPAPAPPLPHAVETASYAIETAMGPVGEVHLELAWTDIVRVRADVTLLPGHQHKFMLAPEEKISYVTHVEYDAATGLATKAWAEESTTTLYPWGVNAHMPTLGDMAFVWRPLQGMQTIPLGPQWLILAHADATAFDAAWGEIEAQGAWGDGSWWVNATAACQHNCPYRQVTVHGQTMGLEDHTYAFEMWGRGDGMFPERARLGMRADPDYDVWMNRTAHEVDGGPITVHPVAPPPWRVPADAEPPCGWAPCEKEDTSLSIQQGLRMAQESPAWDVPEDNHRVGPRILCAFPDFYLRSYWNHLAGITEAPANASGLQLDKWHLSLRSSSAYWLYEVDAPAAHGQHAVALTQSHDTRHYRNSPWEPGWKEIRLLPLGPWLLESFHELVVQEVQWKYLCFFHFPDSRPDPRAATSWVVGYYTEDTCGGLWLSAVDGRPHADVACTPIGSWGDENAAALDGMPWHGADAPVFPWPVGVP